MSDDQLSELADAKDRLAALAVGRRKDAFMGVVADEAFKLPEGTYLLTGLLGRLDLHSSMNQRLVNAVQNAIY